MGAGPPKLPGRNAPTTTVAVAPAAADSGPERADGQEPFFGQENALVRPPILRGRTSSRVYVAPTCLVLRVPPVDQRRRTGSVPLNTDKAGSCNSTFAPS